MNKKHLIYTILFANILLNGSSLKYSIEQTIKNNSEISSNTLEIKSTKQDIQTEKSSYYPIIELDSNYEMSKSSNNNDASTNQDKTDGSSVTLKIEQLLYDGKNTKNKIKEKEYNYQGTLYKTRYKNEDIILDVVKSYFDVLEEDELSEITKLNIIAHDMALEIAYNQEEISGEILETKKTQAMISALQDKLFLQKIKKNDARIKFKKLSNIEAEELCRPNVDFEIIPSEIEDIVELALKQNLKIKEQHEIIKEQNSLIKQKYSSYKPTIKLKSEISYDDGIELNKDGGFQKKSLTSLSLNWNFYNGGKDQSNIQKEKILFAKERINLSDTQANTRKKVSALYKEFMQTKKRIKNFNKSLDINNIILDITNLKLEDGTKTFIDVLLAKTKIYDSKSDIIKQEIQLLKLYFEILNELSILENTIINSNNQICDTKSQFTNDTNKSKQNNENIDELESLLQDEEVNDTNESVILESSLDVKALEEYDQDINKQTISPIVKIIDTLTSKLENIFSLNVINYNKSEQSASIKITSYSFTIKEVNKDDNFYNTLEYISKNLLELASSNDKIKNILIESHTSSEYRKFGDDSEKIFEENIALSFRRGMKVKDYFINKANEIYNDVSYFEDIIKVVGKGSSELVMNLDDSENKSASRRIVIKIINK